MALVSLNLGPSAKGFIATIPFFSLHFPVYIAKKRAKDDFFCKKATACKKKKKNGCKVDGKRVKLVSAHVNTHTDDYFKS